MGLCKCTNHVCDTFFTRMDFGAHRNQGQFQAFLCLVNIVQSIWPILCYFMYTSDIHTVFWLGPTPQYVNLGVPCCGIILNLMVTFFRFAPGMKAEDARIGCFSVFIALGSLLMGAGFWVFTLTEQKRVELLHYCGETPMTARLDSEWRALNDFHASCDPSRKKPIHTCPGFTDEFPNRVFVNYLESLEIEFGCTGFCRFWAKPLFEPDAEQGLRCATALATHLQPVQYSVGMMTAIQGGLLLAVGLMLADYDHL